jgi:hypothetical protein
MVVCDRSKIRFDGVHGAATRLAVLDDTLTAVGAADVNERAVSVAADRTHAFVLTNDGVLCYGLDGSFEGLAVTNTKPLAVVAAKKPLLLTQGRVSVIEPPAAQKG